MASAMSAIRETHLDQMHYDARNNLTLDLDADDFAEREKSTTLKSEDSGIVMISEIQRDEKTHFPRSPGFHFGLDEETIRIQEERRGHVEYDEEEEVEDQEEDEEEDDGEEEEEEEGEEVDYLSPRTISVSSNDSKLNMSSGTVLVDRTQLFDDYSQKEDKSEGVSKLTKDENSMNINKEAGKRPKSPPLAVDFKKGQKCTDFREAVDILKTKYRLADVTIRKTSLARTGMKPTEMWENNFVPVSRFYDRPQYDYFSSKQLKDICRDIEIRDRQLSIIVGKILAEDERARREEERAAAAAGGAEVNAGGDDRQTASCSWVPSETSFHSGAPKTLQNQAPRGAFKTDNTKGATAPPGIKAPKGEETQKKKRNKSDSLLRRAINGLRKSFRRS